MESNKTAEAYVPIKRNCFFTRGQIFDANGRKVCNIPNSDQRSDYLELVDELLSLLNSTENASLRQQLSEREKAQGPDLEHIKEAINMCFEEVTGYKLAADQWSESFEQLDMDGLEFVEFIMDLEARFQISIPDVVAESLTCPKDWIVYLQYRVGVSPSPKQVEPKD